MFVAERSTGRVIEVLDRSGLPPETVAGNGIFESFLSFL